MLQEINKTYTTNESYIKTSKQTPENFLTKRNLIIYNKINL